MFLRSIEDRAGIAALLTMAWAALMMVALAWRPYPFPHSFHHDVDSPVLALEISRGADDIEAVLHRSGSADARQKAQDSIRLNTLLDLVFIPLYALFLWASARVFTTRTGLLAGAIMGTALFDYFEDWRMFQALDGANPAIYIPSLVKWGLLGLVLIATGVILLRSGSPVYSLATKRLLALAYFASGALLVLSVALGQSIGYSLIELAMKIFSLVVLVHAIGLLGHYLVIQGIAREYVDNFCEERKKIGGERLTAVKPVPAK